MCVCRYISLDEDSVAHAKANVKKMKESLERERGDGQGEGHVGAAGTWYTEALLSVLHAQGSLPTTHSYPAQSAVTLRLRIWPSFSFP